MLHAPPVSRLLDAARRAASGAASADSLAQPLQDAIEHIEQGRPFLTLVAWTLPPGPDSAEASGRAFESLKHLRGALEDVATAAGFRSGPPGRGLGAAAEAVEGASLRLSQALEDLRRLEDAAPPSFPLPEVDRVLRVARRALEPGSGASAPEPSGVASAAWAAPSAPAGDPREALQAFLPAAVEAVHRFGSTAPRVAELAGAGALGPSIEESSGHLRGGLGAVMSHLRTGSRDDLRSAVGILEMAAPEVETVMKDLGKAVDAARGDRPAPVFLLARALEGSPPEVAAAMLVEAEGFLRSVGAGMDGLSGHPLAAFQVVDWDRLQALAGDAQAALEAVASAVRSGGLPDSEVSAAAERALTDLGKAWEPVAEAFAGRRRLLARVPALRPAAEAVGMALLGEGEGLEPVLERLGALAEDLAGQACAVGPAELVELLERQASALGAARSHLEQGDLPGLRETWLRLEADLPPLLEMAEELRMASQPSPGGPTEYYDLEGGGDETWVPRRLAELEDLAQRVAAGEAPAEELAAEASRWLERTRRSARQAEEELLPALAGDDGQRSYVEFFLDRLNLLAAGVERLGSFAESGDPGDLQEGLRLCQAAGEDMLAMRFQIQELFR